MSHRPTRYAERERLEAIQAAEQLTRINDLLAETAERLTRERDEMGQLYRLTQGQNKQLRAERDAAVERVALLERRALGLIAAWDRQDSEPSTSISVQLGVSDLRRALRRDAMLATGETFGRKPDAAATERAALARIVAAWTDAKDAAPSSAMYDALTAARTLLAGREP